LKIKKLSVILAVVTLLIGVSTASFATMIDFTDSSIWGGANLQQTWTDGDNTTITATPTEAKLWQDSIDGIGIQQISYEPDEIEGEERLEVSFSSSTLLNTIYIADLFIEGGYTETGFYSLDGGTNWTLFEAITAGNNGELTIDVGGELVTTILFKAPGIVNDTQREEFAVQGLEVNVPEPGTIALLGMGLVGLIGAGARRRRNRKLMESRS
jgi:hypothetical protein